MLGKILGGTSEVVNAHGFLVQEFSYSPDVVQMVKGVLVGLCDLFIHFQVGVKNHTQVSDWYLTWDLILTHMNKFYVYAFELLFTSYNQEFRLAVIHQSMLEIIQLLSSATQFSMAMPESVWFLWPLLLTWFNFNPSMDK